MSLRLSVFLVFLAAASIKTAVFSSSYLVPESAGISICDLNDPYCNFDSQEVRVREIPENCTAKNKGLLRLQGTHLEFCNGAHWIRLQGQKVGMNNQENPGHTCKDIKDHNPSAHSGLYWLDPDGGCHSNAFQAYCDMTSFGGGWTMCYTTDDRADPKNEVTYDANTPYGTDGYRSNCNNVPFTEVIFHDHNTGDEASFKRKSHLPPITAQPNYGKVGSTYGLWDGMGTVSSSFSGDYQLLICDTSFYSGFFVSGFTGNCYKQCNNWCGDTHSPYFRTASTSVNYNGVAFNTNGHHPHNVPNRLMSVGLR